MKMTDIMQSWRQVVPTPLGFLNFLVGVAQWTLIGVAWYLIIHFVIKYW